MPMKQSLICLATLSLLFAACKKDDSSTTITPTPVTKYLQSTIATNGDSTSIEFNMDKSVYRYLTFGENPSATLPSYTSGKIVTIDFTTDLLLTNIYQRQGITFNDLGLPSVISSYDSEGSLIGVDSLGYNTENKLAMLFHFEKDVNTNLKRLYSYEYTWNTKGNIIKRKRTSSTIADYYVVTNYTYDDKINPAPKVLGYYLVKFNVEDLAGLLSANNLLTSSYYDSITAITTSVNNTYQYDEDDYPAVMTLRTTTQHDGEAAVTDSVILTAHYGK
ncbi:hypothetical protein SAMN05428988_5800 [Chitinophaga sp. YR573]|uniref:hypothetical protein n=1 Tax=Chitinophaga sp. YR573 TaxID=1881040 RepID=UPI0008B09EF5|nr:hypothetical protein [Chitinophaga sp. YR573]SEW44564.1 hypothetical protein SAMN05428988_5800 [Chitinophaga sp. YR573]